MTDSTIPEPGTQQSETMVSQMDTYTPIMVTYDLIVFLGACWSTYDWDEIIGKPSILLTPESFSDDQKRKIADGWAWMVQKFVVASTETHEEWWKAVHELGYNCECCIPGVPAAKIFFELLNKYGLSGQVKLYIRHYHS